MGAKLLGLVTKRDCDFVEATMAPVLGDLLGGFQGKLGIDATKNAGFLVFFRQEPWVDKRYKQPKCGFKQQKVRFTIGTACYFKHLF